jgi:hypothetical protein
MEPGMEFRVSRQRPYIALWDVKEVGKIWYLGTFQAQIAVTTDSATAAYIQETGILPSDKTHVQYLPMSLK